MKRIRERAEAATPGPWDHRPVANFILDAGGNVLIGDDMGRANAQFIAAARTDVPALCDEIDRLRAERDALLTPCEQFPEATEYREQVRRGEKDALSAAEEAWKQNDGLINFIKGSQRALINQLSASVAEARRERDRLRARVAELEARFRPYCAHDHNGAGFCILAPGHAGPHDRSTGAPKDWDGGTEGEE